MRRVRRIVVALRVIYLHCFYVRRPGCYWWTSCYCLPCLCSAVLALPFPRLINHLPHFSERSRPLRNFSARASYSSIVSCLMRPPSPWSCSVIFSSPASVLMILLAGYPDSMPISSLDLRFSDTSASPGAWRSISAWTCIQTRCPSLAFLFGSRRRHR